MNFALQNIVAVILIIAAVVGGTYFLISRQQGQYIPDDWADLGSVQPEDIKKDYLQPRLQQGTLLSMNQCIKNYRNFSKGDVLYFEYDNENMLGIVESKKEVNREIIYVIDIGLDGKLEVPSDSVISFTKLPSED